MRWLNWAQFSSLSRSCFSAFTVYIQGTTSMGCFRNEISEISPWRASRSLQVVCPTVGSHPRPSSGQVVHPRHTVSGAGSLDPEAEDGWRWLKIWNNFKRFQNIPCLKCCPCGSTDSKWIKMPSCQRPCHICPSQDEVLSNGHVWICNSRCW